MTSVADAETLFALYQDRLRRYLGRASGETEIAKDLTQEVFLRVSRVSIPVASDSQLAGWLFRIARNVALDHHRKRDRRPEVALGTLDRWKGASQETTMALNEALWFVEWIGGMAWGQYLAVTSEEEGGAGPAIVGPRINLNELLNDFWSRHLLKEVPSIVERVQKLEVLGAQSAPSEVVQLYFMQAMRCFMMGLPEASVSLTRACLEHALRDAVPHAEGITDLEALIRWAGHCRKLDAAHTHMADRVRLLGKKVMHKQPCASDDVFEAVTMLRAVVRVLYGSIDDNDDCDSSRVSGRS